jgi:hypothetical protein
MVRPVYSTTLPNPVHMVRIPDVGLKIRVIRVLAAAISDDRPGRCGTDSGMTRMSPERRRPAGGRDTLQT